MHLRILLSICLITLVNLLYAQVNEQEYRTYDGSMNNFDNPDWGSAGVNLLRVTTVGYEDGISTPAGADRPNPRTVSNSIFAQESLINDPLSLSDFCWVWGQFIDHDIGITTESHTEPAMISVPAGDPWFDPLGSGQVIIPMMRNIHDEATGTDEFNPRQHPNLITAFIDASGVYGSDQERADWLRTFEGGKLKVSEGNLPPFNTVTGEFADAIDPDAPGMDNPTGISEKIFVAGDIRAGENPLLLSFHTLFVREHNRLCDELVVEHPDWTDEELYQHARKIVGGLIQAVVYEEWLPAMGVNLPPYTSYNPNQNPGLMNVFTAAAFRLGHTLLNSNIRRVDNTGATIPEGDLLLRDGFFNPFVMIETGDIDPFLKGMAIQTQQMLDPKVVNDVRNFLFGPPGAGGLDLASININRGRERGLADFNTIRENFGLEEYQFFQQINSDASIFTKLLSLYQDINDIDPWVGMLCEEPMPGALFGETIMEIMKVQFLGLRDGDRFYYENDPVLTAAEKAEIKSTSLHDIIMRNTSISLMQDNVFSSMPHESICENMTTAIHGNIMMENGATVADVNVALTAGGGTEEVVTGSEGLFEFQDLPGCDVDVLNLSKIDDHGNGVSTFDLIVFQKHILGISSLSSPYKIIAGDVDGSNSISTLDLIKIRKVVLGIDEEFSIGVAWRFIPADYQFTDPDDPFADDFPEALDFGGILSSDLTQTFIAVKVGDGNGSADPAGLLADEVEERHIEQFKLAVADMELQAGEQYQLAFHADQSEALAGYQFSLSYDPEGLEFEQFDPGSLVDLSEENFGFFTNTGLITTSWNGETQVEEGDQLFYLTFKAAQNGRISDWLDINSSITEAVAYNVDLETMPVSLSFSDQTLPEASFMVYQNQPNPFQHTTLIPFYLPEASKTKLVVYDVSGKVLYAASQDFAKGHQQWTLDRSQLANTGLLYYQLQSDFGSFTKKMLIKE